MKTHLNAVSLKIQVNINNQYVLATVQQFAILTLCAVNPILYVTSFVDVLVLIQTVKSQDAMATAMKGVTKALTSMNKKVNLPGLQKIMTEFMRENEKSEMTQEMLGDTLDDAMAEEGTEEEENAIVGQVLDELGVNMTENVPNAPTGSTENKSAPVVVESSTDAGLWCVVGNNLTYLSP